MTKTPGIFPTFFLSGFECSTFCWKDQGRRDLVDETQHRQSADADYRLLHDLGIAVAREGIPWPLVDSGGGNYDFSLIDPMIEAMNRHQILPIWDMCHYGYPDDLDPFSDNFLERFQHYCRAAAEYVTKRVHGPHFFTPINEITFFAECGGGWGWVAPFGKEEAERNRLRLALCRAAIAGTVAIREVVPEARMVHIDPLVQVVAPPDRPDLREKAREETFEDTFVAWDVIAGMQHPEFGGSLEILDIVGCNVYAFGQMQYEETGPHKALLPNADGIVPLCELLERVWTRYHRPMIIAETSGLGDGRSAWLKDVMEESLAAVDRGIDLHGVCLFPAVDMPDWHKGNWLNMGICDLADENGVLKRTPFAPYVDELRRWQKLLNRVTELDEDPFSDPVDLADVIAAAKRLNMTPDKDFH
ncbi:MAG: b-glycosidase [Armatimonadota bacterium]